MAFSYSPKIVTDSLIFAVDAVNKKSYSGSGTTWANLAGTDNGTLFNSPTFSADDGGNISFDGTNDYMKVTTTPSSLQGNPNFTVCGWFKRSGDWTNGATWGIGGPGGSLGINSFNFNRTSEITIDLWGRATISTGQTYSTTEWKFVTWCKTAGAFNTTNISIYVNLVKYTGSDLSVLRGSTSFTPNINSNGIVLARADGTSNNYYGKPIISNFMIYDRVLTEQEITQNYNTLKPRFGL